MRENASVAFARVKYVIILSEGIFNKPVARVVARVEQHFF